MLYERVLENGLCDGISVEGMSEQDWLKLRTSGIGGSDSGALLGLNKYATPLSIYLAKKEFASFSGNNATKRGHILEDPVRQVCKKELGITIETVPVMFRNKLYPFMNANFDGLCEIKEPSVIKNCTLEGIGGHEIKTSRYGDGFSEDEIPDSYYSQVQHYMAVTGLNWFILSVYIISSDIIKHYPVVRNDEFIERLIDKEYDFWKNYVEANNIPEPSGLDQENELVDDLFNLSSNVELPEEIEPIIAEQQSISQQIKELKQQETQLKEKIKLAIFDFTDEPDNQDKIVCKVGDYKITWSKSERKSVDSDRLKLDGIYEDYCKSSQVTTLRISGGKK